MVEAHVAASLQNQNQTSWCLGGRYQGRRVRRRNAAVVSVTGSGQAPEPPADVSALDEVQIVPVVAARPHQDAQEVQVVAEVLERRRPGAEDTRGDIAEGGIALASDDAQLQVIKGRLETRPHI